jgi:hypothetical protein
MNLFRAAIHPVSFCTSLMQVGAFIFVMADIFSGLASMPRLKLSSFPEGTPKTHLFGLSFHWYLLPQRCESLFKIGDEHVGVSGLDDHVILKDRLGDQRGGE